MESKPDPPPSSARQEPPYLQSSARKSKRQHRYSTTDTVPAIPAIPARYLRENSQSDALLSTERNNNARREESRTTEIHSTDSVPADRSSTFLQRARSTRRTSRPTSLLYKENALEHQQSFESPTGTSWDSIGTRRRRSVHTETLARLERPPSSGKDMARQDRSDDDLFLELAQDQSDTERAPTRLERAASRLSNPGKRRSVPATTTLPSPVERTRPKSSGVVFDRPSSRHGNFSSDLQRHADSYRTTRAIAPDDSMSQSGRSVSGRAQRFSEPPERSARPFSRLAERMRSPDVPSYGRQRPSFGATPPQPHNERQRNSQSVKRDSPEEADSSEPKQSLLGSSSLDSDTAASTVWNELDELKSRIKKLEHTPKLPPTPVAATSNNSSDRPRTATTAPTTIGSSPKHEPGQAHEADSVTPAKQSAPVGVSLHPLLHAALAKAKSLLNTNLYRTLEATAADALQLAAMTGSAGPQGTAFSAASIINGVTVSDRLVRRKADTMCRNLTDLTLALCEGKHEATSAYSSPVPLQSAKNSPTIRYARSSLGGGGIENLDRMSSRPVSRLEARRTSILGMQPHSRSPRGSVDEASNSELDNTPSHPRESYRPSRAGSRLLSARGPKYDDVSGGDDDPTVRPPSRAMTDIGNLRTRARDAREFSSPGQVQQRSPSLRESLVARRVNASAHDTNRERTRVSSLNVEAGRQRKQLEPSVMEEDGNEDAYQLPIQGRRRVTTAGQYVSRRRSDASSRAPSVSVRRRVGVD